MNTPKPDVHLTASTLLAIFLIQKYLRRMFWLARFAKMRHLDAWFEDSGNLAFKAVFRNLPRFGMAARSFTVEGRFQTIDKGRELAGDNHITMFMPYSLDLRVIMTSSTSRRVWNRTKSKTLYFH